MVVGHCALAGLIAAAAFLAIPGPGDVARFHGPAAGRRFAGFRDPTQDPSWTRTSDPSGVTYTSPPIDAGMPWNELVLSWNVSPVPGAQYRFEAQALYGDRATRWFTMGLWAQEITRMRRESVVSQKDEDGEVQTDTLVLNRKARAVRIRVTVSSEDGASLRYLGLSFLDNEVQPPAERPDRRAWGLCLDVPQRSQLAYQGGKVWCCPASTSMVIGYWAHRLKRPGQDRDVPVVAAGVFDPNWPGTGNWPFNTAFAGALPGMRAYVTRLTGLGELEAWVKAGVPVVCSVSYRLLHGKANAEAGGHVVVCVGFTNTGDVIIHDPWAESGEPVRVSVPRRNMAAAWAKSHNTVFLIYPKSFKLPVDSARHWDSGREYEPPEPVRWHE